MEAIMLETILISALFSAFGGALLNYFKTYIFYKSHRSDRLTQEAYQERLSTLLDNLRKSSGEFDGILHEMSSLATSREEEVRRLEIDLANLENKEREIKDRVENLQNIPLPVADHLSKLMEPEGKKSARRDYLLFLSGVIVSTVIAIILELYFKP
jgi:hypothetical protein